MGSLYERYMKLTVDSRDIVVLDGNPDEALRTRFSVKQGTTQTPRIAEIIVSNLSDTTASAMLAAKKVTLTAGYRGDAAAGVIFDGEVKQVRKGRETPTDTVVRISAAHAEEAYNRAVVNTSLAAGSTYKDHYDTFLKALEPFGITQGFIPTDLLSQMKFPRGVAFFGSVKDHLRTLAHSVGSTWNITNNQLNIVPVSQAKPGATIVLNSSTGLIGMPEQTMEGIVARTLIIPAIDIDRTVQIDQKSINLAQLNIDQFGEVDNPQNQGLPPVTADGVYKVLYCDIEGDTRGNPWYMDLRCLATSQQPAGPVSPGIAASPYYLGQS